MYEFGLFRLDVAARQLLKNGEPVALYPKAFDTLAVLIQKHGHLVTKDEFLKEVWQNASAEESNLCNNISLLRKVLGEDPRGNSYIKTVPRYGYRFVGDVQEIAVPDTELVVQNTGARIIIEEENGGREEGIGLYSVNPPPNSSVSDVELHHGKSRGVFYVIAIVLFVGTVSLVYWSAANKVGRKGRGGAAKSIAVLPFKPIGTESWNENLALGITDATITKLTSLRQVDVRPTSVIFEYAGRRHDNASEAGRELRVDAVLEGTVQRSGDSVRVTVQLINVDEEKPIWAERFDGSFTDLSAAQDAVSMQVAQALPTNLIAGQGKQFSRRGTENLGAYEAYLGGLYFWN